MCVIIVGSKRQIRKEWIIEGMRNNPDGTVIQHVQNGMKPCMGLIKSFNPDDILSFFENLDDDDKVIIHARYASRGGVEYRNIHGWNSHGFYFYHNGTLNVPLYEFVAPAGNGNIQACDSLSFFMFNFIPFILSDSRLAGASTALKGESASIIHKWLNENAPYQKIVVEKNGDVLIHGSFIRMNSGAVVSNQSCLPCYAEFYR